MANSINALAMKFIADTSSISAAGVKIRSDVARINNIIRTSKTDSDKLTDSSASLARIWNEGAISASKLASTAQQLIARYGEGAKKVEELRSKTAGNTAAQGTYRQSVELLKQSFRGLHDAFRDGRITADEKRQAMKSLSATMRELTQAERQETVAANMAAKSAREISREVSRASGTTASLAGTAATASVQTRRLAEQMNRQRSSASGLTSRIKGLAAAYLGLHAATSAFRRAFEFEQAAISFEAFAGSAEKGKVIFQELQEFAGRAPVSFRNMADAAKMLLGYGAAAESVTEDVQRLATVAGGDSERLSRLALAYGQVTAAGRLMGQEVRQLAEAGFNPLQEIARTTGVDFVILKEQMEAGAISASMVSEALQSITSGSGRFSDLLERYAKTAGGSLTILANEIMITANQLIKLLTPAISATANALTELIRWTRMTVSGLSDGQKKTLLWVASFSAALLIIPKIISAIRTIVTVIRGWITAQITLQAFTGPAGWASIAAGAAIATGTVYAVNQALDEQSGSIATATASVDTYRESVNTLGESITPTMRLMRELSERQREADQQKVMDAFKTLDAMRDQNIALLEGQEHLERLKFIRDGATKNQIAEYDRLIKRNKELEEANKLEDERNKYLADRKKQQQQDLQRSADRIRESLKTPFDELADRFAEITRTLSAGLITLQQANLARDKATLEFRRDQTVKIEAPPAVTRGSREEFRLIAERFNNMGNDEDRRHQEQMDIERAQLEAQNRIASGVEAFEFPEAVG